MRPAVCGRGGNLNCWGEAPSLAGGRKTARRKTARRKTRRGGARRSRRRGVRGGRQNNMAYRPMPQTVNMPGLRGGGAFLPAVWGRRVA